MEGFLWLIAVAGGAIILGVAFAYGILAWRRRDRRMDPKREEATRRNYKAEDSREHQKSAN